MHASAIRDSRPGTMLDPRTSFTRLRPPFLRRSGRPSVIVQAARGLAVAVVRVPETFGGLIRGSAVQVCPGPPPLDSRSESDALRGAREPGSPQRPDPRTRVRGLTLYLLPAGPIASTPPHRSGQPFQTRGRRPSSWRAPSFASASAAERQVQGDGPVPAGGFAAFPPTAGAGRLLISDLRAGRIQGTAGYPLASIVGRRGPAAVVPPATLSGGGRTSIVTDRLQPPAALRASRRAA